MLVFMRGVCYFCYDGGGGGGVLFFLALARGVQGVLFFMIKQNIIRDKMRYSNLSNSIVAITVVITN